MPSCFHLAFAKLCSCGIAIVYTNSDIALGYIPDFTANALIVVDSVNPCVPVTDTASEYFFVVPDGLPSSPIEGAVPSVV